MNLKYYSEPISCIYPTSFFFTCNQKYIRNVAKLIIETIPLEYKRLVLAGRGTSGCILCGAVGELLAQEGICSSIFISRKSESHHDTSDMPPLFLSCPIVVIDDFIETGQTVKAILEDLKSLCACIEHVDMLCVSNCGYRLEGLTHLQPILEKFNYIGCNK